ncbi:hypothetical protein ASE23_21955 [Rhizobium sp. Root73]|uniref:helix-turn-helix transcriptional regulator n=1 Tax=unclassified Rhizobium TaxID=2613769 RepID=UPI000727816D|nr:MULTISPECIES: helix-turn-helix domain-containing protein [unclassified Rhizobium]KQY00468.1 hypothetical protein ASD36_20450 [Rhizobium sp. Root1334]KRC11653.1 hypothetical protein ASE23_21955 [Rhizobium sp. Root73]
MALDIAKELGSQLQTTRKARAMTQPDLAQRVGRDRARISELERDLVHSRKGKDRLTLLLDCCDALGVMPLLVPKERYADVAESLAPRRASSKRGDEHNETFENLFVDLSDDEES